MNNTEQPEAVVEAQTTTAPQDTEGHAYRYRNAQPEDSFAARNSEDSFAARNSEDEDTEGHFAAR